MRSRVCVVAPASMAARERPRAIPHSPSNGVLRVLRWTLFCGCPYVATVTSAFDVAIYTPEDATDVKNAIGQLHDHVVALDPIGRLRHAPGYVDHEFGNLLDVVARQQGRILVAKNGAGRFLGCVAGFVTRQSEENLLSVVPTKLGVISDVYVIPDSRGHGVGEAMMQRMESYLRDAGCDSVWITIVAFNKGAASFYGKLGYHEREVGLLKILD